MMKLGDSERRPDKCHALVDTLPVFRQNLQTFSQKSLDKLDWSNVVIAGGAVTACLLSTPDATYSKEFYEQLHPCSDIDIFLYGLTKINAREKIKDIARCIRESTNNWNIATRTTNALTIITGYPIRHIQIILRIYNSISQILTGFDVDCACTAYDGQNVYATPRAITALATQCNNIDLERRSPSYENRLLKYRLRGFEIYWSELDRSLVREFGKDIGGYPGIGLESLLMSERIIASDPNWKEKHYSMTRKQSFETFERPETLSYYHTITIPYGPDWNLQRTEDFLAGNLKTRQDKRANAWVSTRTTHLHLHPFFVGSATEILGDPCGKCPPPITQIEVEYVENVVKKYYVSGNIDFIADNPGHQKSGSFNPVSGSDWTEYAYKATAADHVRRHGYSWRAIGREGDQQGVDGEDNNNESEHSEDDTDVETGFEGE